MRSIYKAIVAGLLSVGLAACGHPLQDKDEPTSSGGRSPQLAEGHPWCDLDSLALTKIRQVACADLPILSDPNVRDREKVRALRSWVSSWWPESGSDDTDVPDAYWNEDPQTLFINGYEGRHGGSCGSASWTLMNTYIDFGFESWVYNFGDPDSRGTHVVTLVEVENQVLLQDAHLNAELTDPSSSGMDIRQGLREITSGKPPEARMSYQSGQRRAIVATPRQFNSSWMNPNASAQCLQSKALPGNWVCTASDFVGTNVVGDDSFWRDVSEFLQARGHVPSYEALMLYPINLTGADGVAVFNVGPSESRTQQVFNELWEAIHSDGRGPGKVNPPISTPESGLVIE